MTADSERLLPPNNPDDFESLCLDLWKEVWGYEGAEKNGRSGQPQAGVDVWGQCDGRWIGVQCKRRDGLLRTSVTVKELEHEVQKAKSFKPGLSLFILATTGPADAELQQRARELTDEHRNKSLFSVEVWSWEKIWHEIYVSPDLLLRIGPVYWPKAWRVVEAGVRSGSSAGPEPAANQPARTDKTWRLCHVVGNSLKLNEGIAGTHKENNGHHKSLFPLETTAILGDSNKRPPFNRCQHSTATWEIPIDQVSNVPYRRCFLLIGNLRHFGGLHSPVEDDYVEIFVNDEPIDGFEIRLMPEGQTDYFHKRTYPDIPKPEPFDTCQNLYAWPVPTSHLAGGGTAQLRVRIAKRTKWDIDYVGLYFELT